MSLLATGRVAGTIWVGRGEKARSQARCGQGLPSGAPQTAGHQAGLCQPAPAMSPAQGHAVCDSPDSSQKPRDTSPVSQGEGWSLSPLVRPPASAWEYRVHPPALLSVWPSPASLEWSPPTSPSSPSLSPRLPPSFLWSSKAQTGSRRRDRPPRPPQAVPH